MNTDNQPVFARVADVQQDNTDLRQDNRTHFQPSQVPCQYTNSGQQR